MIDAWDILPPTERSFDQVTNFILFCEDEVSEVFYFSGLQIENTIKIACIPNTKSKNENYLFAVEYCIKNGLAESVDGKYTLLPDIKEHIWSVYDRDCEHNVLDQIQLKDHLRFTTAIINSENAGIKVAWSNDAFELWILLHFEDVIPGIWLHRDTIYNRLTEVFKNLPDKSEELQRITSHPKFDYKTSMKKRSRFIQFIKPFLDAYYDQALQRAYLLESAFPPGTQLHLCNPVTKVHHLAQSIKSFY